VLKFQHVKRIFGGVIAKTNNEKKMYNQNCVNWFYKKFLTTNWKICCIELEINSKL